jgi:hypothetical protein
MKNFSLFFILGFACIGFIITPSPAQTQTLLEQQTEAFAGNKGANFGEPRDPRSVAATIIQSMLGLLGILMITYLIYGGYLIMTSAGQEEKLTKGKSVIRNAVIGIAIILSAYGIARLVMRIAYSGQSTDGLETCIERPSGTVQDPLGGQVTKPPFPYCDEI